MILELEIFIATGRFLPLPFLEVDFALLLVLEVGFPFVGLVCVALKPPTQMQPQSSERPLAG